MKRKQVSISSKQEFYFRTMAKLIYSKVLLLWTVLVSGRTHRYKTFDHVQDDNTKIGMEVANLLKIAKLKEILTYVDTAVNTYITQCSGIINVGSSNQPLGLYRKSGMQYHRESLVEYLTCYSKHITMTYEGIILPYVHAKAVGKSYVVDVMATVCIKQNEYYNFVLSTYLLMSCANYMMINVIPNRGRLWPPPPLWPPLPNKGDEQGNQPYMFLYPPPTPPTGRDPGIKLGRYSGPVYNYSSNASVNSNSSVIISAFCKIDLGSLFQMPSLMKCIIENSKVACSPYEPWNNNSCIDEKFQLQFVKSKVMSWIFAKVNYCLIILMMSVGVYVIYKVTIGGQRIYNRHHIPHHLCFSMLSIIWLLWRLQETLESEVKWNKYLPYLCIFTDTLRYLVESTCIYLFAWTSIERYRAVTMPLMHLMRRNKVTQVAAACLGLLLGAFFACFNIIVIFQMNDFDIRKTCIIPFNTSENLLLLIILKASNLLVVYLVPSVIMVSINISMAFAVRRSMKWQSTMRRCSSVKRRTNRAKLSFCFLIISSMILVCCIMKPIFYLYLAIKVHLKWDDVEIFTADNILEGIIWNLSTLAYGMNTLVLIHFAPSTK